MSTRFLPGGRLNASIMSPSQCLSVFCFGRRTVILKGDSAEAGNGSALQDQLPSIANAVMEYSFPAHAVLSFPVLVDTINV